jgi:glutamate dehydrogenase (NAD(P)+)
MGGKISNQELLGSCDVPAAALEMQSPKPMRRVMPHSREERGPTTPRPIRFLEKDLWIPDILANAGGVVVSYFEWVQDLQNFFWTEDEVHKKLRDVLVKAFHEVLDMSRKQGGDMRMGALMIGIDRVAKAMLWRGLYA